MENNEVNMDTEAYEYRGRFYDLVNDLREEMQGASVHCYGDGTDHYIEFGDGSVIMEPDDHLVMALERITTFDEEQWEEFRNAETITECEASLAKAMADGEEESL